MWDFQNSRYENQIFLLMYQYMIECLCKTFLHSESKLNSWKNYEKKNDGKHFGTVQKLTVQRIKNMGKQICTDFYEIIHRLCASIFVMLHSAVRWNLVLHNMKNQAQNFSYLIPSP